MGAVLLGISPHTAAKHNTLKDTLILGLQNFHEPLCAVKLFIYMDSRGMQNSLV